MNEEEVGHEEIAAKKKKEADRKIRPIVPSIVSPKEFRRLNNTFNKMRQSDPLWDSYRVSLEKGVRKPNVTKLKNKNRRSMIAESRKTNRETKGRTKK